MHEKERNFLWCFKNSICIQAFHCASLKPKESAENFSAAAERCIHYKAMRSTARLSVPSLLPGLMGWLN